MVSPVAITHSFDSDPLPQRKVDTASLDAILGMLASTLNAEITARQGVVLDGGRLANSIVRFANLHPEVAAALGISGLPLLASNNLSDVANVATAKANLGLTGALLGANNLSDVPDKNLARQNLGVNGALLAANNLSELAATLSTALTNLGRNQANGLAGLDAAGRLPAAQLPAINSQVDVSEDYVGLISSTNAALSTFPILVAAGGVWSASAGLNGYPGILRLGTGTTGGTGSATSLNGASIRLGNGQTTYETVAQIPTLGTAPADFWWLCGLLDGAGALPTNGAYFRYKYDENSGKIRGVCVSSGTPTYIDTGITLAAGTWMRLSIVVNALGTLVQFYINGTLVGSITTNIPTATALGGGQMVLKNAGTTDLAALVDYQALSLTLNNPR